MLGRILDLFRGKPVRVQGTSKLPEGFSKKIDIGDPLAGGRQVILCRVHGELLAIDVRCPHEGGRIVDGPLVEGKWALCPLHNYAFDPKTGVVKRGSCDKAAKTYKVREANGDADVWV